MNLFPIPLHQAYTFHTKACVTRKYRQGGRANAVPPLSIGGLQGFLLLDVSLPAILFVFALLYFFILSSDFNYCPEED